MKDLFNKSIDLSGLLEDVKKVAAEAAEELRRKDLIDVTGTKLTPSPGGKECLGNGSWVGYECCCDECDYFMVCFPEAKFGLIWDEDTERYI